MRKTVVLLASMAATVVLASMVALITTGNPARAAFPGKNGKIAFLSDRDGQNEIYTNVAVDSYPVFSPGGGKIVFSSDRKTGPGVNNPTGDEELFIKNANPSGDPQQITFNQARDVEPDWQPIR